MEFTAVLEGPESIVGGVAELVSPGGEVLGREADGLAGPVVAGLGSEPYALLPLSGSGEIWRSVTIEENAEGEDTVLFAKDRIDYSATGVLLRVETDGGGPDSARVTFAVSMPRFPDAAEPPGEPGEASSFCSESNLGCVCLERDVDGGSVSTVSCPDIGDWWTGGWPPGEEPTAPQRFGGGGGRKSRVQPGPAQKGRLDEGLAKARSILDPNSSEYVEDCANLFRIHGLPGTRKDGLKVLSHTRYFDGSNEADCRTGREAFAYVGGYGTWLCDSFETLLLDQSTRVLIHEALHSAGLKEGDDDDDDDDVMTFDEINALVGEKCDLRL